MNTPESPERVELPPSSGGTSASASPGRPAWWWVLIAGAVAIVTFVVVALLVTIFEHRQDARVRFVRLVEVDEGTSDPRPWGVNWPYQYETYLQSVDNSETEYGGSSAMPASKLESDPWLKRLYAGYAFSLDYREARGHAYMLYDQTVTERVTQRPQSGACLHCHASVIPMYRRIGLEVAGQQPSAKDLGEQFNMDAVMAGFRHVSTLPYGEVLAELQATPDGSDRVPNPSDASQNATQDTEPEAHDTEPEAHDTEPEAHDTEPEAQDTAPEAQANAAVATAPHVGGAHPVSCVDCHDPETMQIRVTRPGFIEGIALLAESDASLPHLPSIQRWRDSGSEQAYDPNRDASRQEMRSFVCAQCHVEYYCATRMTLTYPWGNGLKAEEIEQFWDETKFDDGEAFYDYEHGETGALAYKAQHPEFELWSQGIHARSGVSCSDCHMPFERKGAMKVSNHEVSSPLLSINRSCQTCHNVSESELLARVETIQDRTRSLMERAAHAMTDMLDAIRQAQAAGHSDEELQEIYRLQRSAMWRLDFISSENSLGFHADQEAARVLAESIDYSRQAQTAAVSLRAPQAPTVDAPTEPVQGVTPTSDAPVSPQSESNGD